MDLLTHRFKSYCRALRLQAWRFGGGDSPPSVPFRLVNVLFVHVLLTGILFPWRKSDVSVSSYLSKLLVVVALLQRKSTVAKVMRD